MPSTIYASVLDQAQTISEALAAIPGVRAVVLGGSWARGAGDAYADIDLALYYHPEQPLALEALRRLAAQIDDSGSGEAVTEIGGWGPWINGGAWLTVGGQRVDLIYRDLVAVRAHCLECIAGRPTVHYQPGHPHGYHTHMALAEAALCQALHDPAGEIAALKALAHPYPALLRQALAHGSLWEAGFALETTRKSVVRGDVFHVIGSLFRCAACLTQTIFALNERYWLNEKGAIQTAGGQPLCPVNFAARVQRVLSHAGVGPAGLEASVDLFAALVDETRALCAAHGLA